MKMDDKIEKLKAWVEQKIQIYESEITPDLNIWHRLPIIGKLELCRECYLRDIAKGK
jgi:hypothetical protein